MKNFFVWLCFLVVFLKLPFIFEGYWHRDEGTFAAVARGMSQGKELYSQIYDHKPQAIFWLFQLGVWAGWPAGLVLIRAVAVGANIVSLWFLMHLFAQRTQQPNFALLGAAVLLSTFLFEGPVAYGEVFFLPTSCAVIWWAHRVVFQKKSTEWFEALGISVLVLIGFLFKQHSLFESIAVTGLVGLALMTQNTFLGTVEKLKKIVVCWILVFGVFSLWLFFSNQLDLFVDAVFIDNVSYSAYFDPDYQLFGLSLPAKLSRTIILLVTLCLLTVGWYRNSQYRQLWWASAIFCCELYLATLSGRPYLHYLLQIVPGATLIAGELWILFKQQSKRVASFPFLPTIKATVLTFMILSLSTFVFARFESRKLSGSLGNLESFVYLWQGYAQLFGFPVHNPLHTWRVASYSSKLSAIATEIDQRVSQDQKYYFFGNEPWVIALSQRVSVNKWVVWFHLDTEEKREQELVRAQSAEWVLIDTASSSYHQEFQTALRADRKFSHVSQGIEWYRKK